MSYTKTQAMLGISDALTAALAQAAITDPVQAELLAAGSTVTLETGDVIWVSCIAHDRPETPQIDFITVAIAGRAGAPWYKANGQVVASVFWHGMWPDALASLGIDTVRRALMMVALGEPQPQVPIANPAPGGPTMQDAIPMGSVDARSVRTVITAAAQVAAPLVDVL